MTDFEYIKSQLVLINFFVDNSEPHELREEKRKADKTLKSIEKNIKLRLSGIELETCLKKIEDIREKFVFIH